MRTPLPLAIPLALLLAGCFAAPEESPETPAPDAPAGEDSPACTPPEVEETGPSGGQTAVSNERGSFTYGGQVAAKTATEVFLWENPSSGAQITWGGQSGAGSLALTIQDACGEELYSREMGPFAQQTGVVETTGSGEPGEWILTFSFTLYTGQMGLTINSE